MHQNPEINRSRNVEYVDGQVLDNKGIHLDLNKVANSIVDAAVNGLPSSEDGVVSNNPSLYKGEVEEVEGRLMDKSGFHLDASGFLADMASTLGSKGMKKLANKNAKNKTADYGQLQPIWEELEQIPFTDNYEEEIALVRQAIRQVGKDIKAKNIVANTKKLAKNAQNFYHSDSGMRVVFSILGHRFSMAAKGDFTGREAFYLQVNGDSLDGIVVRQDENGDFGDVTANYLIEIKREK